MTSGTPLRRARVLSVEPAGAAPAAFQVRLEVLEGPLQGRELPGFSYPALGPPPQAGSVVQINTLGPEMGLGTGGGAFVLPEAGQHGANNPPHNANHFVKLPYTPLQTPALPAEQARSLRDVPVVVLPLHSHLAPAVTAVATAVNSDLRVAFVWQEGGALPVGFSRTARELRAAGLLAAVVSCGNCFGGDLEAPNVYSGLLAAARVADVVLCGIGPGVVGTAAVHGHGGMSAAVAMNAAVALEGEPVLAPRLSYADDRERHRGLSHHSRAIIGGALGSCRVALPQSAGELDLSDLPARHEYRLVRASAAGLEARFGLTFTSMGRGYHQDPVFFDAAVAAVKLALGPGPEPGSARGGEL